MRNSWIFHSILPLLAGQTPSPIWPKISAPPFCREEEAAKYINENKELHFVVCCSYSWDLGLLLKLNVCGIEIELVIAKKDDSPAGFEWETSK